MYSFFRPYFAANLAKRVLLLPVLFLLFIKLGGAQDVTINSVSAPDTGCVLTANEDVIVQVFNPGSVDITVNIGISYRINGGPPVTETIPPTLYSLSPYTYSFATKADLSAPGTYTLSFYTSLPGDINPGNDTLSGYLVNSDPVSAGGVVSSNATVCSGSNMGTLTVSSYTGTVAGWESSTDGGGIWTPIANTSVTIGYSNVLSETLYRAIIKSGVCPQINSSTATITTDPVSNGGTLSSNTTVCSGTNTGTLTLSGHTGDIQNWESSASGGSSWTPVANTSAAWGYSNITSTTLYRTAVKSGVCPIAHSSTVAITADQVSDGGNVLSTATVCSGLNTGTLTLSGYTGNILNWESSVNSGGSWTPIVNTTPGQTYNNLTADTWYRAQVKNGVCAAVASSAAILAIDQSVVNGGIVSANTTACSGLNTGTLTLSGYAGNIIAWETSTNGFLWSSVLNTTNKQSYTDLATTTFFRARVQNGVCPAIPSSTVAITIIPLPTSGTASPNATVCVSSNNGIITLSGHTGNILRWESSTDNGLSWIPIANTANTQNYTDLTDTTWYRAQVQTGICPAAPSTAAVVSAAPLSEGGTVLSNTTVCAGSNSGTLLLSGNTGSVIGWEFSEDNGASWTPVVNPSYTLSYTDVSMPTLYRAMVQSGACAPDSSAAAMIRFFPTVVNAGNDTTIVFETSANLYGNGGTTYLWFPDSRLSDPTVYNPVASPTTTTVYTLAVTDLYGCSDTDFVMVKVIPGEFKYMISNLITSNNDGINDTWYIQHIEMYPASEALIFNASGQKIYQAAPYLNDWDGTYNGKKLPDDAYYYILKFTDSGKTFQGTINILSDK